MIWNIVDNRSRKYRWKTVNVIIENTAHDNDCKDSDQLVEENEAPDYEQRVGVLLHEAIQWAEAEDGKVTLYLYDEGESIG